MLDFQGLDPLAHIANNYEEADGEINEEGSTADSPSPSKKRKRMDHTRTKESIIESNRKIQNQEDVENAVMARQIKIERLYRSSWRIESWIILTSSFWDSNP